MVKIRKNLGTPEDSMRSRIDDTIDLRNCKL